MVRPGTLNRGYGLDVETPASEQVKAIAVQRKDGGAASLVEGNEEVEGPVGRSTRVRGDQQGRELIGQAQSTLRSGLPVATFWVQSDPCRAPHGKV